MLNESLKQLRLLGFENGDRIYIRLIAGKGFDVQNDKLYPFDGYLTLRDDNYSFTRFNSRSQIEKGKPLERFTVRDGHRYLMRENLKGYGVYLIPNMGGRKDEQITRCQSFFYEADDDVNWVTWNALREFKDNFALFWLWSFFLKGYQYLRPNRLNLDPSLIIETRNSLHVYYRTVENTVEGWREYQQRLIQLMDSDPSIHNESRLMRLAGYYHQKKGSEPLMIRIVYQSDAIYNRNQFDEILPQWDESRWGEERTKESPEEIKQRLELAKLRHEQSLNSIDGFPLEICLSKDDRDLISQGVSQGGRNANGFKLASNLIGTENWLTFAGYQFTDTAELLFEEYCDRCSPPISDRERHQIWLSASRGNPTPSLPDEAIENCIKSWQWNQLPDEKKAALKGKKSTITEPDQAFFDYLREQGRIESAIATEETYQPITPITFCPIYAFCDHAFDLIKRLIREEEIGQKQIQLNSIVRSPNLTLNSQHYQGESYPIPEKGLLFLNAYKKWGKTRFINELVKVWKEKRKHIISIVPRILLGKNQEQSWQLRYIDSKGLMRVEDYPTIDLCYDSLGKLIDYDWDGALVILDELRQGLKHLYTSSTLEERRSFILKFLEEKLTQVITTNGLIVGADADLTELEMTQFEKLSGTNGFLINNEYVPKKGTVTIKRGKVDDTISEIIQRFKDGENLTIFCEHKSDSKAIYDRLKAIDEEAVIWLINGDTSEKPEVKAIIENDINAAVKEQKPRALIFTSSMSTGISIDGWINNVFYEEVYHHFHYQFALCHGDTLEPVDNSQALVRVRKDLDMTIYCGEGKIKNDELRSCDPDVIKRTLFKRTDYALMKITQESLEEKLGHEVGLEDVILHLAEKIKDQGKLEDSHLDYYCKVTARQNYHKQNFPISFRQQLIDEGYTVIDQVTEDLNSDGDRHRDIKKENQFEEAEAISNAEDITLEEAQEIHNRNATKEERDQVTKAFLKAELPEVELTPDFIFKATIKDRRRWLKAVKLFWFYLNPEIAKEIDTAKFIHKLKQFKNGVIYLPDIKSILPVLNELKAVGLFDLIDLDHPEREISKDDPNVKKFMQRCYFRRYKLYTALGITVTRKTDPIKLVDRLLGRVGLRLKNSRTIKNGDRKIRYYNLDTKVLNDPDRIQVLQALDRRFIQCDDSSTSFSETVTQQDSQRGQDSDLGYTKIGVVSPTNESSQGQDITNPSPVQIEDDSQSSEIPESVDTQGLEQGQDSDQDYIKIGVLSPEHQTDLINRLNWTQTFEEYLKIREDFLPYLEIIHPQLWPHPQRMIVYWERKLSDQLA